MRFTATKPSRPTKYVSFAYALASGYNRQPLKGKKCCICAHYMQLYLARFVPYVTFYQETAHYLESARLTRSTTN